MSNDASIADYMHRAEVALAAGQANAEELAGMEGIQEGLQTSYNAANEAFSRRAFHRWQAQQATRDLEDAISSIKELLSRLRRGVQAFFGIRSEKNAEFGFSVFRASRQRKPNTPPPLPEDKKPSEPGPNPALTAAPETDGSTF